MEWKEAFEGSEIMPNERVWNNIDRELSNQGYKKRIMLLYWLAAASVAFAAVVGGVQMYRQFDNFNSGGLSSKENVEASQMDGDQIMVEGNQNRVDAPEAMIAESMEKDNRASQEEIQGNKERSPNPIAALDESVFAETPLVDAGEESIEKNEYSTKTQAINSFVPKDLDALKDNKVDLTIAAFEKNLFNRKNGDLFPYSNYQLKDKLPLEQMGVSYSESGEKQEVAKSAVHLEDISTDGVALASIEGLGLTDMSFEDVELQRVYATWLRPEKEGAGSLWAGVRMAGGGFNPTRTNMNLRAFERSAFSSEQIRTAESAFNAVSSDQSQIYNRMDIPGSAVSYGFDVGKQLSERWVMVSGINYSTYNAGWYEGTEYYGKQSSISSMEKTLLTNSSATSQSLLQQNNFTYISIPAKVGYKILNRKLGISVSSGVVSNLLALSDYEVVSTTSEEITAVPLDLNPVTIWGVVGTEFTYQLGGHYLVAVSPNYKLSINSMEKGGADRASLAEVGVSMRYMFD